MILESYSANLDSTKKNKRQKERQKYPHYRLHVCGKLVQEILWMVELGIMTIQRYDCLFEEKK